MIGREPIAIRPDMEADEVWLVGNCAVKAGMAYLLRQAFQGGFQKGVPRVVKVPGCPVLPAGHLCAPETEGLDDHLRKFVIANVPGLLWESPAKVWIRQRWGWVFKPFQRIHQLSQENENQVAQILGRRRLGPQENSEIYFQRRSRQWKYESTWSS